MNKIAALLRPHMADMFNRVADYLSMNTGVNNFDVGMLPMVEEAIKNELPFMAKEAIGNTISESQRTGKPLTREQAAAHISSIPGLKDILKFPAEANQKLQEISPDFVKNAILPVLPAIEAAWPDAVNMSLEMWDTLGPTMEEKMSLLMIAKIIRS